VLGDLHYYSAIRQVSAATTLLSTDHVVEATSGSFGIDLPDATAEDYVGHFYIIKNSGTGAIVLVTDSDQTIQGDTSYTLDTQYDCVMIFSNGVNWIIVAQFIASSDLSSILAHLSNTANPHSVTAAQTGAYTEAEVDVLIAAVQAAVDAVEVTADTAATDATQALLNAAGAQTDIDDHVALTNNPHSVTAAQAGAVPESTVTSTASTSTTAIDVSGKNHIAVTLQADTELQFDNVTDGRLYHMEVIQDGTGGWLPTLEASSAEVAVGTFTVGQDASERTLFVGVGVSSTVIRWMKDETVNRVSLQSGINSRKVESGLYFDGETSGARGYSTLTGYSVGTDDVSIRLKFKAPESISSQKGLAAFSSATTGSQVANGFMITLNSGGDLKVQLNASGDANSLIATSDESVVDKFGGEIIDVVVVRDASTPTIRIFINGDEVSWSETNNGTPPAWSDSITSTYFLQGVRAASEMFEGDILQAQVFNLALSADDVATIHRSGIPFDLQQASPTAIIAPGTLNGGFESVGGSPFDDWSKTESGTSTVNDETSDVVTGSHACRMDVDGSGSNVTIYQDVLVIGKRYAGAYQAKCDTTDDVLRLFLGDNSGPQFDPDLTTSYQEFSFSGVAGSGDFQFKRVGSSANRSIYIDDVTLTRTGCIVDLDMSIGDGTIIEDRSGNGYDATITSGVSHVLPAIRYREQSATGSSIELNLIPGKTTRVDVQSDTTISAANISDGAAYVIQIEDDGNGPYTVNFDSTDFSFEDGIENVSLNASGVTMFYGVAISSTQVRLFRDPTKALNWLLSRVNSVPDLGGVYLDGTTSGARVYSTLSGYSAGTDGVSLRCRFQVPTSDPSAAMGLIALSSSNSSVAVANSIQVNISTSGNLQVRLSAAADANYRLFVSDLDIVEKHGGEVIDVVMVKDSENAEMHLYFNGEELSGVESTGASPNDWDGSVTSTYLVLGVRGDQFLGSIYSAQVFNMALSKSQVEEIHRSGVPFDLQQASPTAIIAPGTLNGGFETTGGGPFADWTEGASGSSSVNDETTIVNSGSHACRIDIDGSNTFGYIQQNVLEIGKRYQFIIQMRGSSGGETIRIDNSDAATWIPVFTLTTSYAEYTAEDVATAEGFRLIRGSAANESLYIDDLYLYRRGCVLDLDLTAPGRFFPDRSGNGFHGEGTDGVSNLLEQVDAIRDVDYASTVTIDFDDYRGQTLKIASPSGALTLDTDNIKRGDEVTIIIAANATSRTLTFPAWIEMDSLPSATTSNKRLVITLKADGTADADVMAWVSEET
tara:strand:- start:34854 stop:38699 length:3846 start_codon:yes stop_codon:yes gene_type:complete